MITNKTRKYWLKTLRDWAEDRLSPPQFDECCEVLDAMTPTSTDELPPEHEDVLWWYPFDGGEGWRMGCYNLSKSCPPGFLWSAGASWYLVDGPTYWMYPPPDPTEGEA